MYEQQKPKFAIIAGAIGVVVVIILIAIVAMSSGKKTEEKPVAAVSTTTLKNTAPTSPPIVQHTLATTSADLSKLVVKESILRSTNGGDSFSPYFTISTSEVIGLANVLSITFHPKTQGKVVVSSYEDGLFSKSEDKNTWDIIPFPPKKIYSFILDRKNPEERMFASGVVEGNGRIFRTEDGGESWKAVYVEPGLSSTVTALSQNPRNVNIIYSGTSQGTVVKSVDGGNTWKNIGNKLSGIIKYISFDAKKPAVVYLLSLQKKVYYSSNEGATWIDWEDAKAKEVAALYAKATELSRAGDKNGGAAVRAQADELKKRNLENKMPAGINLIVSDPSISGTLYAGTKSGLYRSTDLGKYWTALDIIESAKGFPIRSLDVNPKNSKEVVFVAGKAFYKTINGGTTWSVTPLSSDRNASFVVYDPFDVNTFYVGVSSI